MNLHNNGEEEVLGIGIDLTLTLVAVLVVFMSIYASYQKKYTDYESGLEKIQVNQDSTVNEIAAIYNSKIDTLEGNKFGISTSRNDTNDIIIQNSFSIQHISFGSHILFDPDDSQLKTQGKIILKQVALIFKKKIDIMQEVQIQGHADNNPSKKFRSNLELAALRSIEVFSFFQNDPEICIDPVKHQMSVVSYGEFKPIQRRADNRSFNKDSLISYNRNNVYQNRNRRIEILLIYRVNK